MKTLEAILSLLVFITILVLIPTQPKGIDNSLYQLQLVNDVWRVFQLRGDLHGFDKTKLNLDAEEITKQTSLCLEFEEEDVTSCIPRNNIVQVRKTVIANGEPKIITLRVGS